MTTIITITDRTEFDRIERTAAQQADHLNMRGLSIKTLAFDQVQLEEQGSPVIIDICDPNNFELSLELIVHLLIPSSTPFIYISSINIASEAISKYFPDQLLISPYTEESVSIAIRLFLQKIKSGYFEYPINTKRNNRLWLPLKRGVYISLEANEIKYVEAEDHYIKIHSDKQSLPLIKSSLKDFYNSHLADFGHFCVLSRSCVINSHKIRKVENGQLYIDPNKPLPIPKGKREEVLKFIGIGGSSE